MPSKPRPKRIMSGKTRESLAAVGFLLPNFLGFLVFTSIPVIVSLIMAFTHWNIFRQPSWVGMENFRSLLWFHREAGALVPNDPFFWQYVYNTVYLMIGIPFGMAASLIVALMMNQKVKGIIFFRAVYFLPAVCSGVALLILWKYLYNGDIGLINKTIRLMGEQIYANKLVALGFTGLCAVVFGLIALGAVGTVLWLARWLSEQKVLVWVTVSVLLAIVGILYVWQFAVAAAVFAIICSVGIRKGTDTAALVFRLLTVAAGAAIFIMLGVYGARFQSMLSGFFTTPPDWLGTVRWAKPSLIIMGLWGGLGGYNMILYLAALQGVPTSYYEAADIDGAGPWAKFWSVTWPMVSPTTFFILIMSVIGGFQSGFMTADVMTGGGPAGSTTTIEYYLYQTAFQKFHMGYASAIAWFMFAVILALTLVVWKLGGRVVTYE